MIDYNSIPKISGLYYLYDEDLLLYIGKAVNIRKRLKEHQIANFWSTSYGVDCTIDLAWNQITKVIVESISKPFLSTIEKIMINKLRPLLNKQTRQFYFPVDSYLDLIEDKRSESLNNWWIEQEKDKV